MKPPILFVATLLFAGASYAAVNINTATKDELEALPGIGTVKAQAIIDYRNANGPFNHVEELKGVKGMTVKDIDKLKGIVDVRPGGCPEGPPCPNPKPKK